MEIDRADLGIEDGYGYFVDEDDLAFLGIQIEDALAMSKGTYPLGMTSGRYAVFRADLQEALNRDGINDADVRLQGSSARFFSGHHKPLPATGEEIAALIRASGRFPLEIEIEEALAQILARWPAHARPRRRPFDLTYRTRIDYELSDYDVQISCRELSRRAVEFHRLQGAYARELLWKNPDYNFISKDLYGRMCPHVQEWAVLQSKSLGRSVTLAIFDEAGPPRLDADREFLSSHFRDTDWFLSEKVSP